MVKILSRKTYDKISRDLLSVVVENDLLKKTNTELKEKNNSLQSTIEDLKSKIIELEFELKEETALREKREKEEANYLMDREADYD